MSSFSKDEFEKRFPNIYHNFLKLGYKIPFDKVPISPAFHYSMGGIKVDNNSLVANTKNLFAVGEVACTGVHGANRLASNSLLEGLVFSHLAVEKSLNNRFKIDINKLNIKQKEYKLQIPSDKKIKEQLRNLMWKTVGIIRNADELKETSIKIDQMLSNDIGRLLYLRLLTASAIVKEAINNTSSIGAHYLQKDKK